MASIGWIDFSPSHRARVGTILELLKPAGMVDELGVGVIRDTIADKLFPGISTIQTRAKYFFIIPYIISEYQQLKPSQRNKEDLIKYLERREYEVMWKLGDQYNHEEGHGVIGITKHRPNKIMRRPSEIYWDGISKFHFIETNRMSRHTFLLSRNKYTLASLLAIPQGDGLGDDQDAEYDNIYGIKVPYDRDWNDLLSLNLTEDEAEIFKDSILSTSQGTALHELIDNKTLYEEFNSFNTFRDFAKKAVILDIPESLKRNIILAHDFSELMYGANIAYNCMLQKAKFNSSHYEDDWLEWVSCIKKNMIDFPGFKPENIIKIAPTAKGFTKKFITDWWNYIVSEEFSLEVRNKLIEDQEYFNKRGKSRLKLKKHDEIYEKSWIGLRYLEYRYSNVKQILNDILTPAESD